MYQTHVEKGQTGSLERITSYLDQRFRVVSDPTAQASHPFLTAREHA